MSGRKRRDLLGGVEQTEPWVGRRGAKGRANLMFGRGDAGGLRLRRAITRGPRAAVLLCRLCTHDLQRALLSPSPWDWLS